MISKTQANKNKKYKNGKKCYLISQKSTYKTEIEIKKASSQKSIYFRLIYINISYQEEKKQQQQQKIVWSSNHHSIQQQISNKTT